MRHTAISILFILMSAATGMAQERQPNHAADEAAVRAVASGLTEAWNRHDMKAFAALFAEDADFVNVIGMWWRGRAEIQREHEALHATRMKDSQLTVAETSIRFVRPDVAVVHLRWHLSEDTGLEAKPLPPRNGLMTLVTIKTGDSWLITAAQNTDIVPLPNVPPMKSGH